MNPVVDILQKILKNRKDIVPSERLNGKGGFAVFSYKESFEALWGIEPDGKGLLDIASCLCQNVNDPTTLAIVWDGIPGGNTGAVNTARYLTPIDWAVALSLAIKRAAEKNQKLPKIRIAVLDIGSRLVPGTDVIQLLPYLSLDMPWIRFFQQDGKDEKWYQTFVNEVLSESEPAHFMNNAGTSVDVIERIWKTALTRTSIPGDQHAIANIVGPLLLMEDDVRQAAHAKALRSLMKALGLIPDKAKREAFPWIKWDSEPWKDRLSRLTKDEGKLNLILIDDQYTQGWGEVLCKAVGAKYNKSASSASCGMAEIGNPSDVKIIVKAAASAYCLLSRLNGEDQRFNFNICSDPAKDSEILFLDLRLFSGKDEKEEADFFKRLISLAEKFIEDGTNNLPWKGFTPAEIEKVKNWIKPENRKREDDNYATALTLLPRILALTDMSLPIIIFSSTGRRDIAETLKGYGNIITDFDKPKFTVDMPEDIAEQTKRKFQEALEKAVLLLQGREKCRKIIQNASSPKSLETQGKGKHVELYIDENFINARLRLGNLPLGFKEKVPSRLKGQLVYYDGFLELQGWMTEEEKKELLEISNNEDYRKAIEFIYNRSQDHAVRVGGLFAIFSGDTLEGARNKADLFDDICTDSGIMYFDPTPSQNSTATIKDKKEDSVKELATAMGSKHKPEKLFFVRLSFPIPDADPLSIGNPFDPRSADNLYRHTLSTLIELFLSEVLPALFGQDAKNVSVSIFVATKLKPLTGNDLNNATYSTGQVSSNYDSKDFLTTISRDSVHPFVLDTLAYHQIERKICRAIGVTLPYKKGTGTKTPKFYICRTCKEQRTIDELKQTRIKPCSCGTTIFKPDYRALQYIADETLNHVYDIVNGIPNSYGASIIIKPWGFDEEIKNLGATISSSRKLDNKDVIGSIIEVDPNSSEITQLLSGRVETELKGLKGWDFCRIAVGLSDEKLKAINLYRFLIPRVSKNSGTAKGHRVANPNRNNKNKIARASSAIKPIHGGLEQKAINTPTAQNSSVPINIEKEFITVTRSEPGRQGIRFICKSADGRDVIISPTEVKKTKSANPDIAMNIGSALKARIDFDSNKFFARDIELMTSNEAQDISLVQAGARTNEQGPKKAGEPIQGVLAQKAINAPAIQKSSDPIHPKKEVNPGKSKSGTLGKMSDLFKNVELSKGNDKP